MKNNNTAYFPGMAQVLLLKEAGLN